MSNQRIAIVDYGMGNLHSVASALEHVTKNCDVLVTSDVEKIHEADRVVLPGVGAIRDCVGEVRRLGFDQVMNSVIASGKPILGICVGMQMLLEHSEENQGVDCLGFFPGRVRFFGSDLRDAAGNHLKVPHMGWNGVNQVSDHPLWNNIASGSRFYFVHSYYVEADAEKQVAGRCDYSISFAAALAHNNVFAVQFHPEKSHLAGLQLLKNFASWDGQC